MSAQASKPAANSKDTFEIIRREPGPRLPTRLQERGPGGLLEAEAALAKYNPSGKPLSHWTSMSGMETTIGFGSSVVARMFHEDARVRHMAQIEARCEEARRQELAEQAKPYDFYELPRKDPKDIWL